MRQQKVKQERKIILRMISSGNHQLAIERFGRRRCKRAADIFTKKLRHKEAIKRLPELNEYAESAPTNS